MPRIACLTCVITIICLTLVIQPVQSQWPVVQWNLPATAFSTKFMGETLRLLKTGPAIDPVILQKAIAADRKAIMAVLTIEDLYKHGKDYSNQ